MSISVRGGGVASASASRESRFALEELQRQAIALVLVTLVVVAWGILAAMAVVVHRISDEGFLLASGIVVTAAITYRLLPESTRLSAGALSLGLLAMMGASLAMYPQGETVPLFALVVLVSTALLGWAAGIVVAAAGSAAVLVSAPAGLNPSLVPSAVSQLFLFWATVVLTWLLSRPQHTALHWAWQSYAEALQKTEQLRDRQAELVRVSKSLNEAYVRLENLTEELDRARQSAEQARELKAQFAVAISHELRTPLNLVIGFSEMMVLSPESSYGEKLPKSYRGDVEAIYCNACHISNLIDDVLDLSQVEAHRMALQKERTSLSQVIEEATKAIATMVKDKRLELKVDVPPDLPTLLIDPVRVRQVIINLLANATRFTDYGGITVSATTSGDDVVVSVADTGVGIAPEDLPRLFEDFQQAGNLRERRGGSGVGLAVSKRLIELHGGNMWVESKPGQGSTFRFTLPRREAVIATPAEPDWTARMASIAQVGSSRAVVVVDDEGDSTRLFQRYLDGYQVIGATSVADCRHLAESRPVHALIFDSTEMRQEWMSHRTSRAAEQDTTVVVCPLRTRKRRIEELGVVDYLVKPVSRDRLRRSLRKLGASIPDSILVVDDDGEMVRLLVRTAASFSPTCRVWSAADGERALEILREHRPGLVLLDLLMPGMDGYAVLRAMREEASLRDIPVIVVTGWGGSDETVTASGLEITRNGGLAVGEVMRCLKAVLDHLPGPSVGTALTRPTGSAG